MKMFCIKYWVHSILFLFIVGTLSCSDDLTASADSRLSFSMDTVKFDTVFTSLGSVTRKFLIYNKGKSDLLIQSIGLSQGKLSLFRINVDGTTSADNQFKNIKIRANDSMYVFVSVTINPNNSDNPVLVEDALTFTTGSLNKKVILNAIGQDIILFKNRRITSDSVLTAQKPFFVMGELTVDSLRTLTISAGCRFYFYSDGHLKVNGTLIANGSFEKPIVMRGHRFDKVAFEIPFPYNNIWGQWGGVTLNGAGRHHVLQHVFMNGGAYGIIASNTDMNQPSEIKMDYCRIHNFTTTGLMTENHDLNITNTEISNTGSYCVYIKGGKHSFVHCTLANYFNDSDISSLITNRRDSNPALLIMNMERCSPMESNFQNCIITGSKDNEFSLATLFADTYKGNFESNYIKRPNPLTGFQFKNTRWAAKADTIFINTRYMSVIDAYFDFRLDSVSVARGIANKAIAEKYPLDLLGNDRIKDNSPDLGAYQWMPHK